MPAFSATIAYRDNTSKPPVKMRIVAEDADAALAIAHKESWGIVVAVDPEDGSPEPERRSARASSTGSVALTFDDAVGILAKDCVARMSRRQLRSTIASGVFMGWIAILGLTLVIYAAWWIMGHADRTAADVTSSSAETQRILEEARQSEQELRDRLGLTAPSN